MTLDLRDEPRQRRRRRRRGDRGPRRRLIGSAAAAAAGRIVGWRSMPDRDASRIDAGIALAGEFPAADLAAWEALAGDVDRLRSTTLDGLTIEPLYTSADAVGDPGLPGFAPFVRGRTASGTRAGGWEVRQMVDHRRRHGSPLASSSVAPSGLFLNLRRADVIDADLLDRILDGVYLDLAPVVLDAGDRWRRRGRRDRGALGTPRPRPRPSSRQPRRRPARLLGVEPVARRRRRPRRRGDAGRLACGRTTPACATYVVNGTRFANAGASDALELGFAVAYAVATLRSLTDGGGFDPADALRAARVPATRPRPTSSPRSPSSAPPAGCGHVSPRSPACRTPPRSRRSTPCRRRR